MSQPPNQPYPGQPYPDQPPPGPAWPGQAQPWSAPPASGQPYPGQPGQPYQGQPNPDVPSSVPPQPGYPPQPAYVPQPSYPQPGYPQPGPPMQGYPPPKKKSKAVPITLVSVALVLVLCVGGGTAIYLAGRNTAEGIADVIASAAPTQPTQEATTEPPPTITIVEPRTLGGRPKVTDPKFAATADQLEKNLALLPAASQSVGAIYGTPAKQDLVVIVAASSYVGNPKAELDSAFTGRSVDELNLTGISSIPAGPLGGVAKCAKGSAGGTPLSMCAWADEGSSGWVFWYFTSLSKAKAEFVKIRGQVEKKSN